jgi:DNA-binding YbaB/EbfC family protein
MDMMQMLGAMKDMQANLKATQEGLKNITESAEAGGGIVKATVNGKKELIGLEIDKDILKPEDKEMVQDLVIAAVNKALTNIEEKIKQEMSGKLSGMLPNIPGLDLKNFL